MKFRRKNRDAVQHDSRGLRDVVSFVVILALAAILAWAIIAFVFESYQVDGPSMQNTLHNNDRLIVWKLPRTWARITGHAYIPARGDIIIFQEPGAELGGTATKNLVKRVVGLPGDRVVVKNGNVTIYNSQHPNGWSPARNFDGPDGHPLTAGNQSWTLKKNQVFVMGDNRPDSFDSRDFGPINASQIVGKLILRDWPISNIKVF